MMLNNVGEDKILQDLYKKNIIDVDTAIKQIRRAYHFFYEDKKDYHISL